MAQSARLRLAAGGAVAVLLFAQAVAAGVAGAARRAQSSPCAFAPAPAPAAAAAAAAAASPAARRCLCAPQAGRGSLRLRMADTRVDGDSPSDGGFQAYIESAPQRLLSHLREGSLDEDGRVLTKKFVIELEQLQVGCCPPARLCPARGALAPCSPRRRVPPRRTSRTTSTFSTGP